MNKERKISVVFPSHTGDESRMMTIQELEKDYGGYLIIDPSAGEQVDLERLANLDDIKEVVVMPPIVGGSDK
jgi:hypothetical protein